MFTSLKTDPSGMLFFEEKIDSRLLKKLKKSKYAKDKLLLKLVLLADNLLQDEGKIPTRTDFIEKREIDRSTLYSLDGPYQLIHADIENLELLGSSATTPRYALLIVDLYFSKIYCIQCVLGNKLYKNWLYFTMKSKIKEKINR